MNQSKRTIFVVLSLIGLFGLSLGLSYLGFRFLPRVKLPSSQIADTKNPTPTKKPKVDPSLPKDQLCPLNGAMFTKPEKDIWVTRRPLAVMIENSVDSRPQSGLSAADIVYEAVAEGGITRFMGLFYCNAALEGNLTLAPVRSARIYFVNFTFEYDPLYVHVGGAGNCDDVNVDPRAKALCAIQRYNVKDLDQMGRAGDFKTCHRLSNRLDHEVAYEHTMACFIEELNKAGAKWGWTNIDEKKVAWDKNFVSWKFLAAGTKATGTPATTISYAFWQTNPDFQTNYNVSWVYDSASDTYVRSNGGKQSLDLNTGEPLRFKTVIVQFAKETVLDDVEKHVLYDTIGTGKGIAFMNGTATQVTWSKPARTSRTLYYDAAGKELKLNPGTIWISIVPTGNTVNYQ
jgi:hypothetical protein